MLVTVSVAMQLCMQPPCAELSDTCAIDADGYVYLADRQTDMILAGGYEALAGAPADEILMRYDTKS